MNAMNPSHMNDLADIEGRLAALTRAPEEPASLWRGALEEAARSDAPGLAPRPARSLWHQEISILQVLGVAAIICLMVGVLLPSLGKARRAAPPSPSVARGPDAISAGRDASGGGVPADEAREGPAESSDATAAVFSRITANQDQGRSRPAMLDGAGAAAQPEPHAAPAERHVIRKATLELTVADVHAAFLKAQLLVSDATGEYVEASSLRGEGDRAEGHLTLRVAASRLSEVLNLLRPLGTVASEQQTGEDVTAAVVDVEARLRNERQVEEEMLELLDTRAEAPLNDVLTLRARIAEVRGEIERLEALRERFSRLTSLATVLVILRPEAGDEGGKPGDSGLQVGALFEDAWEGGVRATIQTLAVIVRVLVGGALWWVLLVVAIVVARRRLRRQALLEGRIG